MQPVGQPTKANNGCHSECHLMLLPHFPCRELPQLVTRFFVIILNPALYSHCYICIVFCFNSTFLVRVLAMPHPLCTYTLECCTHVAESLYPLYISPWNGIYCGHVDVVWVGLSCRPPSRDMHS